MKKIHDQPEHVASAPSSNEHAIRAEKVAALHAAGLQAWPATQQVNATAAQVTQEFNEAQESRVYKIAGRLMTMREHGKTAFAHIQDRSGRVQVYIRQDVIGQEKFDQFKHFVDIGDIVWVTGTSFKTKTGEITIKAQAVELLSKCLHPLPEKFHGLHDVETAYRQRYLDLISNPESRQRFVQRSTIVRTIRNFLDAHDFIEVETPMLQSIPGGAAARPFVTHHNALDMQLYMRIAPELYLKRLVVGGFERVYEINRNFRNEGISTKHNPEFTMLEFYMAYQDYHFGMDFVEELLRAVVTATCTSLRVPFGEHILDFETPFARMSMQEAVMKYGNLSAQDLEGNNIDTAVRKHNIKLANANAVWGHKLYALFEELVEPNLLHPTFITDFPIEVSPLAKRDPNNPHIAARFELFIAGIELSNGFNELNDPYDQAARFKEQVENRAGGDAEAHHYDAEYVQALEYALPPTVGVGIGIDRLTMFLTNTTSIKDVILFPTLKRKDDSARPE
jgi:lysyl-tRNA synthetase class 2